MLSAMPNNLQNQYRFQQGAGAMGYNPQKYSGEGQMFQGYGSNWGYSPQGWGDNNRPWQGSWGAPGGAGGGQMPGIFGGGGGGTFPGYGTKGQDPGLSNWLKGFIR